MEAIHKCHQITVNHWASFGVPLASGRADAVHHLPLICSPVRRPTPDRAKCRQKILRTDANRERYEARRRKGWLPCSVAKLL